MPTKDIDKLLKQCNSLNEIIETMNRYYDLDKKLGVMSKSIVIQSLNKVILICNLQEK